MSLLTVMAGAAVAPALGLIKDHFASAPTWQIQFIISLPALFIVFTNLLFSRLCHLFRARTLALAGLLMYAVCGVAPYFFTDMAVILVFRALLGVSVGIIMPLSTGLLSYYYPPEKQGALMGLSAAMNQMGGFVATFLAGFLASISWNCSFLVYLLGLIAVVLVTLFLPNERIDGKSEEKVPGFFERIKKFHPSVIGMFLCMSLFFVYPSNFAIITHQVTSLSGQAITIIMVALEVVAFLVGLFFAQMVNIFKRQLKYFAPVCYIAAYAVLAFSTSVFGLLCGSFLVGLANGVGVPYLNTIASIKAGKTAATTVMPLISAALYLGQFLSPIYISQLGQGIFKEYPTAPYLMALIFAVVFLLQVFLTRNKQAMPPFRENPKKQQA